ncbi:MAG: M67 family metallopeptidase [Anaerolineae bacterium]|jgi:proteasome lid subunit RPN8/RPN11|nr:M67 family metallopeptidase [Anaerolineae bacterium]MBT7075902.1 M67 family metallopeptidase [Anaerolineae bacterium]MBT7781413.1 M67 family metallopeptidase [Anaerolineae bacterium]
MLKISAAFLKEIHRLGEKAYPEEGVGFLFGIDHNNFREVRVIYPVKNAREKEARHNRYTVTPQDIIRADESAEEMGLSIVGVFHSHPDHPDEPSAFDLKWANTFFSYIITSVKNGTAITSRSWRLKESRSGFLEEKIVKLKLQSTRSAQRATKKGLKTSCQSSKSLRLYALIQRVKKTSA